MSSKEPQPRFSAAEDDLLIELVAGLPILYDAKLKEYKNTGLKDTKWKQIGEEINKTADQCKTRWRSIRDHYKKVKKAGKLPTGTAAQRKSRKTYFDRLLFLDRVETERESTTNVEDIDMSDNNDNPLNNSEDDNHSEPNSDIEEDNSSQSLHPASGQRTESPRILLSASASNTGSPLQSGSPAVDKITKIQGNIPQTISRSTPAPLSAKPNIIMTSNKRKTNENDKIMAFLERQNKERTIHLKKLETCLKQEIVEDEIDLFFKTMAASVKKFPAQSKTSIKIKISQIVFEEESRLSALQDSSSITTFDYSSKFHLTSPESASSRPPSSSISNFSYESSMSETIPVPTPSPDEPQLDSNLNLTPYWLSYNDSH